MTFKESLKYDRAQFGYPEDFEDPREVEEFAESFYNYGKKDELDRIKKIIKTLPIADEVFKARGNESDIVNSIFDKIEREISK